MTSPEPLTIRDLYACFRIMYGSVPPLECPATCWVCLGVKGPGFATCAGCLRGQSEDFIGAGHASWVVPLSTAFESGDSPQAAWYRALREYKRTDAGFDEHHLKLVAMLGMGLHTHRQRIEQLLGGPIDTVTVVPSSRPHLRGGDSLIEQPLYRAAARLKFLAGQLRPLLRYRADAKLRHTVSPAAFECVDPDAVRGERIVLVDDTWVSGAGAVSAREGLLGAGAAAVLIIVAARVVRPSYAEEIGAAEYLDHASRQHDCDHWPR